jgi:hypothetical protein
MLAVVSILRRWVPVGALFVVLLPAAGFSATITVNDSVDPGSVGDASLSLTEAIRLATGDLSTSALSTSEHAQVSGTPGAGSADTIGFSVTTVTLAGNVGGELLPPLDTGNDTIDGGGTVTLNGASANPAAILTGLHVSTSGNVIQGLAFEDVPGTCLLINPPTGGSANDNAIKSNRFTRCGIDAIRVVAAIAAPGVTVTGGLVQNLLVDGNTLEVATANNQVRGFGVGGMNFIAAYLPLPGGTITGARILDTTLRNNVLHDVYQGLFVRTAVGDGVLENNEIARFVIEDGVFERITDSSLLLVSGTASGTGRAVDNALSDVTVRRNTFRTQAPVHGEVQGGAIFLVGGMLDSCFDTVGMPTSLRNTTNGVDISDNEIVDRGPYGIFIQGSHSCGGAGGSLTESMLENISITGNTVRDTKTGISLQAASTVDTADGLTNSANVLRHVTVSGNHVVGASISGIEFIGAFSGNSHGRAGATSGNTITDVTVSGNTLEDDDTGIVVNTAIAQGPVAGQGDNVISGLTVADNTVSGSSFAAILLQTAVAAGGSRVADNRIEDPTITGNILQANRGLGIYLRPAAIGDSGHVEGNSITGAQVKSNEITDTTMGAGANNRAIGVLLGGFAGNTLAPVNVETNTITRVDRVGISIVDSVGHMIVRNRVAEFGRKPFTGNKRKNKLIGNVFGPKAKKKRKA